MVFCTTLHSDYEDYSWSRFVLCFSSCRSYGSDGSVSPAHSAGSVQSDFLGELKTNVDAAKMPPPPATAPGSPAHNKFANGTLGMFKCCSDVYVVL